MTLRERFLDAVIDGQLGNGLIVTRSAFMEFFADVCETTTGCFLSNSAFVTGESHSPHYDHVVQWIAKGEYRVDPHALMRRMASRGLCERSIATSSVGKE